jgi:hypothetical protein
MSTSPDALATALTHLHHLLVILRQQEDNAEKAGGSVFRRAFDFYNSQCPDQPLSLEPIDSKYKLRWVK